MSLGVPNVVVEFRRPACTKRFKVDEKYSGKKTACKACGKPMEVPFPPLELPEEKGGEAICETYSHRGARRRS